MLTAQYMGFLFILKILSVESALYELRGRFFIESRIQCLLFLGSRSSDGVRGETLATKPKRQRICVTLSPRARSRSPIHWFAPAGRTAVGGRLYELVEVGHFVIRCTSRYVVKAIKPRVHFV